MQLVRNASGELVFGTGAHQLTARQLLARFGSPLFVYDEATLRERARTILSLSSLPSFHVHYSAKVRSPADLRASASCQSVHSSLLLKYIVWLTKIEQEKLEKNPYSCACRRIRTWAYCESFARRGFASMRCPSVSCTWRSSPVGPMFVHWVSTAHV